MTERRTGFFAQTLKRLERWLLRRRLRSLPPHRQTILVGGQTPNRLLKNPSGLRHLHSGMRCAKKQIARNAIPLGVCTTKCPSASLRFSASWTKLQPSSRASHLSILRVKTRLPMGFQHPANAAELQFMRCHDLWPAGSSRDGGADTPPSGIQVPVRHVESPTGGSEGSRKYAISLPRSARESGDRRDRARKESELAYRASR
jgi:hypothetical protein